MPSLEIIQQNLKKGNIEEVMHNLLSLKKAYDIDRQVAEEIDAIIQNKKDLEYGVQLNVYNPRDVQTILSNQIKKWLEKTDFTQFHEVKQVIELDNQKHKAERESFEKDKVLNYLIFFELILGFILYDMEFYWEDAPYLIPVIFFMISWSFWSIFIQVKNPTHTTQVSIDQEIVQLTSKDQNVYKFEIQKVKATLEQNETQINLMIQNQNNEQFYFTNQALEWSGKDLIKIYNAINASQEISKARKLIYHQELVKEKWVADFPYDAIVHSLLFLFLVIVFYYYLLKGYVFVSLLILFFGYLRMDENYKIIHLEGDYLKIYSPFNALRFRKYRLDSLKSVKWALGDLLILELDQKHKRLWTCLSPEQIRSLLYTLEQKGIETNY